MSEIVVLRRRIKASQKMLWGWQVSTDIGKVDVRMTEAIAVAELGALGTLCETAPADEFDQLLVLIRDWEALRVKVLRHTGKEPLGSFPTRDD